MYTVIIYICYIVDHYPVPAGISTKNGLEAFSAEQKGWDDIQTWADENWRASPRVSSLFVEE